MIPPCLFIKSPIECQSPRPLPVPRFPVPFWAPPVEWLPLMGAPETGEKGVILLKGRWIVDNGVFLGDNHGWGNDPKIAWVVIFRELTDIFSDN